MDKSLEAEVGEVLREKKATVAVAESCTGGLIANRITNVPGSSDYFDLGIVAYSNKVKIDFLGISEDILKRCGAVSPDTAMAMASGIRKAGNATFGVSVTGIAGPGGGSAAKPVGLVYIAVADPKGVEVTCSRFEGSRDAVKEKTADAALTLLLTKARKL